jgi:hypothetical protein
MVLLQLILAFSCARQVAAESMEPVVWPAGKTAVAWQTRKRMFLLHSVEPVGLNTEVKVKIVKLGELSQISIAIPIDKFASGEPKRDREVVQILKADTQPNLEFNSRSYTPAEWSKFKETPDPSIAGVLKIGGQDFPVTFQIHITELAEQRVIEGLLATTFSAFKIDPPTVGAGLIAKVKDELYLYVHIFERDIENL